MGHGGIAYLPFGREAQRARSDRRYSSSSRPAQDRERPPPGPCGTRAPVTRSSPLSRPSFGNGQAARGRAHATCAPTVASPSTASAASTRRAAPLRARWWSWTSGPPAAELPAGRARDRARLPRSGGRRQARRNAKRSRSTRHDARRRGGFAERDEDHAHGRAVGDEGDDPHVGFACPRRSATSRSAGPVATCSTSPRRPRSTGSGSRRAACSGLDGRLERAAPHGARFFQPGGNRRAPPAISLTSGSRPALCVVILPGAAAGRPRGPTNLIHLDPLVADDRGPAHDLVADELRVGLGRARDDVESQLLQLLAHGGHGKCQLER